MIWCEIAFDYKEQQLFDEGCLENPHCKLKKLLQGRNWTLSYLLEGVSVLILNALQSASFFQRSSDTKRSSFRRGSLKPTGFELSPHL